MKEVRDGGPEAGNVFSFRLNEDLPHERRVLRYLRQKKQEGQGSIRKVVVDALLQAIENEQRIAEIAEMQRRTLDILERLENGGIVLSSNGDGTGIAKPNGDTALTEEFKNGLRKIARPMLKLDELDIDDSL